MNAWVSRYFLLSLINAIHMCACVCAYIYSETLTWVHIFPICQPPGRIILPSRSSYAFQNPELDSNKKNKGILETQVIPNVGVREVKRIYDMQQMPQLMEGQVMAYGPFLSQTWKEKSLPSLPLIFTKWIRKKSIYETTLVLQGSRRKGKRQGKGLFKEECQLININERIRKITTS